MSRYENKLNEISIARNSKNTASKTRGIKWTKNQETRMRLLSAEKDAPTIEKLKAHFPSMSEYKLTAMLSKIKFYRKKLAEELNLSNIDGIRNSNGKGYIYLIENESYNGWIKCGMTTNISERLNSYNINDPLKRFNIVAKKEVNDRRKSERELIYNLEMISDLKNGEWFKIDKNKAIDIFEKI